MLTKNRLDRLLCNVQEFAEFQDFAYVVVIGNYSALVIQYKARAFVFDYLGLYLAGFDPH